jgi:hypothetical protein
MNGVEFLFALSAVIGMTSMHFLWINLAYKMENIPKKAKKDPNPDFDKDERVDDMIDYDGMGQGRLVSENRR